MTYELITTGELAKLHEIHRLLDEANAHALAIDGHCKSSEGSIEVDFGNHWDRLDPANRKAPKVSVYSYLLGPHRMHHFDSIDQALEVVQQWHRQEMGATPEPDLYSQIRAEREAETRALFDELDEEYGVEWPE